MVDVFEETQVQTQIRGVPGSAERFKLKIPSKWEVIMHNDDYTPMGFVVEILCSIFRKSKADSVVIMLAVHKLGQASCGQFSHEMAETKITQAMNLAQEQGYPLLCTMHKIED